MNAKMIQIETHESQANSEQIQKPEWLRIPEAVRLFGISRAKFYDLISKGRIKSVSLRERGQTKGTRLLSYDSIHDYLEILAEEQNS